MSYNLHEIYTARTNLNLSITASLRKITHLPQNSVNFWEGEMGMMEHVLQYFPEPKRAPPKQDDSLVIPASENSTMANSKQGNLNVPSVFGENKQASTISPIMNNSTIEIDNSVSLIHPVETHESNFDNKTLIPSHDVNAHERKINSMPLTESHKRVTSDSNMQSEPNISHIVISDNDSDVELVVDVLKKGHLKNDVYKKERQCHTKIAAGTDNQGNSEDNVKQNLNTLSGREKLLSSTGFGNRLENTEKNNKASDFNHVHAESSDVSQNSSNKINCGIVLMLASPHQSVGSNHQSPKEDSSQQLIHEIKESKATLKALSKELKLSKAWVKSAQYKQFVSFQMWMKQVECKLNDKLQLTKNVKRQKRYHKHVDADGDQWIIAKRAFLDFKNMYETIRRNRCDLFPNS